MDENSRAASLRLSAGRVVAAGRMPYLSTALFAMVPVLTRELPTFGVDARWRMYANPDFVLTLDPEEVAGAWLHEAGHLLHGHRERWTALAEPQRRHPMFNAAADAAINEELRDAGVTLPAVGAYYWERIPRARRGMIAEQMYRLLRDVPAGSPAAAAPGGSPPAAPSITLSPDHLATAPSKITVRGSGTRFGPGTVVTLRNDRGHPVPHTVADVRVINERLLTAMIEPVPAGLYRVEADGHPAVLPIGLPFAEVSPSLLPAGHGTPYPMAAACDDFDLDPDSTLVVARFDDDGLTLVPDAADDPAVVTTRVLNFDLLVSLPAGAYAVVVGTAGRSAVAVLVVDGSPSPAAGGSAPGGSVSGSPAPGGSAPGGPAPGGPAPGGALVPGDCGSGAGGERRDWEEPGTGDGEPDGSVSDGRAEMLRHQVAREIQDHQRTAGDVPAGLRRFADETLTATVDWRRELRSVVSRSRASVAGLRDYTYARPSRRASAVPGLALPAMRAPRPPRLDVVIDTSGSMSAPMLGQVTAELRGIIRALRGDTVRVLCCDARSGQVQRIARIEDVTFTGGGGTDMRAGLNAAAALRPRADLIVLATDGDTPWPAAPPADNPRARYVVVLVDGDRPHVPSWMRKIIAADDLRVVSPA
jgi:predicted metal-dependent peptidase